MAKISSSVNQCCREKRRRGEEGEVGCEVKIMKRRGILREVYRRGGLLRTGSNKMEKTATSTGRKEEKVMNRRGKNGQK